MINNKIVMNNLDNNNIMENDDHKYDGQIKAHWADIISGYSYNVINYLTPHGISTTDNDFIPSNFEIVDFFVLIPGSCYVYLLLYDDGNLVIDDANCDSWEGWHKLRSFYSETVTRFVKQPCTEKVYIEFSDGYEIIVENGISPTITLLNCSPEDAKVFFSEVNILHDDYEYVYGRRCFSFFTHYNFRSYEYVDKWKMIEIENCEKSIQEAIDSKRILCDDMSLLEPAGTAGGCIFLYTLNDKIILSTPEYTDYDYDILSYDILKREETYIEINKEYIDYLWNKSVYAIVLPNYMDPSAEEALIRECSTIEYERHRRPFYFNKFCGDTLIITKLENGIVTKETTKLKISPKIFDNRSKTVKSARSVIN